MGGAINKHHMSWCRRDTYDCGRCGIWNCELKTVPSLLVPSNTKARKHRELKVELLEDK